MSELSVVAVRDLLPSRSSVEFVQSTTETLNKLISDSDPEFRQNFRDNIIGFSSVFQSGKYKLSDYANAVKFVCHRMSNMTFGEAYRRTFPDRYSKMVQEGKTEKAISSHVSAYSNNKMVIALLEQAAVPVYLANADIFQEAINVQAALMRASGSDLVKQKAADSLMSHLRPPETAKLSVDVTVNQSDVLSELREVSRELAKAQLQAIEERRHTVLDIAHRPITFEQAD